MQKSAAGRNSLKTGLKGEERGRRMLRNPGVGVINGGLGAVLYALLAVMMMITTRPSSSIVRESMTRTNIEGSLERGE